MLIKVLNCSFMLTLILVCTLHFGHGLQTYFRARTADLAPYGLTRYLQPLFFNTRDFCMIHCWGLCVGFAYRTPHCQLLMTKVKDSPFTEADVLPLQADYELFIKVNGITDNEEDTCTNEMLAVELAEHVLNVTCKYRYNIVFIE